MFVGEMNGESQSQFHAGLALAETIHKSIVDANEASRVLDINGIRVWWLHLEDVYRFIAPRLKNEKLREKLEKVRVKSVPLQSRGMSQQTVILFYRRKLTEYQIELETSRDKLGLGFKAGDDPSNAMLRG